MSKAEIQSWIIAAETPDDEEEAGPYFDWTQLNEESKWPTFMDYATGQILTSSTRKRIDFIENRVIPLVLRGGAYSS